MFLFQTEKGRNLFEAPLITKSGKSTWIFTKEKIEILPISNYEETDARLIFNARMNNEAVIVTKDADAFLLLI